MPGKCKKMTLEQCIEWRKEIKNRTQHLVYGKYPDIIDNLFETEYFRAREAGKEFDAREFAEWARLSVLQSKGRGNV